MKEDTSILHLNAFNRILSDSLTLGIKLEEDKVLLLSFLPSSYDHLATIIMYGKETLELEDVRQMLQNNELMKKTDSTKEASRLFVKGHRGRSKRRGPKRDPELLAVSLATFARKQGISRKLYEIQGDAEEEGGKDSDGASTSVKSDRAGVVEEAYEDSCDVLTAESGKCKYSDAWLLDSGCTYHMCPKKEVVQYLQAL